MLGEKILKQKAEREATKQAAGGKQGSKRLEVRKEWKRKGNKLSYVLIFLSFAGSGTQPIIVNKGIGLIPVSES